ACYFCSPDIIVTLIEAGAEIDAQTEQGRTALHELCRSPTLNNETLLAEIACILIDADNMTKSSIYANVFVLAAYHNHPSVVLVLLESHSFINHTDQQGWTALHWAIDRDHVDVVQLLIDKGIRTDIRSHRGELAISRVKSCRIHDIMKHIKRQSLSLADKSSMQVTSSISMIDLEKI
ncbi:unnamed protein product, partial [Adineta ricciae]